MPRSSALPKRLILFLLPALLFSGCFVYVHEEPCPSCAAGTLIIRNDAYAYGSIWYAYAVPSSWSSWGGDLLGESLLQPGDELIVDVFECGRYYDFRVEYDHGLVIEKEGVWLPCDAVTIVPFID